MSRFTLPSIFLFFVVVALPLRAVRLKDDEVLQEKILNLFCDFKQLHKTTGSYRGCHTPKTLDNVEVNLPWEQISAIYDRYHIIQLRSLSDAQTLLVGCGNSTEYKSDCDDKLYDCRTPRFIPRSHEHHLMTTVDRNLFMNPVLVAKWGSKGLLKFFTDNQIRFSEIIFEGFAPKIKTYVQISEIAVSGIKIKSDSKFFYFSNNVKQSQLSPSKFADLKNLCDEFQSDPDPFTNNDYYVQATKPFLAILHNRFLSKTSKAHKSFSLLSDDYPKFYTSNFDNVKCELVHLNFFPKTDYSQTDSVDIACEKFTETFYF